MADYHSTVRKTGAYKIDKELILTIYRLQREFLEGDPECSACLEGDHKITVKDPSQLFDDPLVKAKYLNEVTMEGRGPSSRSVSVEFAKDHAFLDSARLIVAGESDRCIVLRGKIESLIDAKKQWYSFLMIGSATRATMLSTLSYLLIMALSVGIVFVSSGLDGLVNHVLLWTLTTPIWLTIFLSWVRPLLFPKIIFEIGQSADLGRRLESARNLIFVVMGLGLVVGIAAEVIAKTLIHGE
jgi:hypothetical protein